jgi:hypothetical protein
MEESKERIPDLDIIIKSIRRSSDKDSKAYKVTDYYSDLINHTLDAGGIALVKSKVLNIEKHLKKWVKKYPNNETTIMQPEESAIILINDLRNKGLFK